MKTKITLLFLLIGLLSFGQGSSDLRLRAKNPINTAENLTWKNDTIKTPAQSFSFNKLTGLKGAINLSSALTKKLAFNVATGVYNRKFLSVPFAFSVVPVARNAAHRVYNSFPALYQSVKKSRLAYIGAPYYGYYIVHQLKI